MGGAVFTGSPIGIGGGVVFTLLLGYACASDIRARRIPNSLVVALAVSGLVFSIALDTVAPGLARGAGGLLVGFAIWVPFWLLGWLGAGDVKLFAAAGAWLGVWGTLEAAVIGALVGALLAVGWLVWKRGLRDAAGRMMLATIYPRLLKQPVSRTADPRRLVPYALALAAGLIVAGWFPSVFF